MDKVRIQLVLYYHCYLPLLLQGWFDYRYLHNQQLVHEYCGTHPQDILWCSTYTHKDPEWSQEPGSH